MCKRRNLFILEISSNWYVTIYDYIISFIFDEPVMWTLIMIWPSLSNNRLWYKCLCGCVSLCDCKTNVSNQFAYWLITTWYIIWKSSLCKQYQKGFHANHLRWRMLLWTHHAGKSAKAGVSWASSLVIWLWWRSFYVRAVHSCVCIILSCLLVIVYLQWYSWPVVGYPVSCAWYMVLQSANVFYNVWSCVIW